MSIAAMAYVWDHSQHDGNNLLLMLAIADYANERGIAWPAIKTLARRVRVDERTAQRCLKRCLTSGELKIQEGAGPKGCHLYQVVIQENLPLFVDQGVAFRPPGKLPGVAIGAKRGDTAMSPEPPRTTSKPKTLSGGAAPTPVSQCSDAYRAGIKKRYAAEYPASAKLNGIMSALVKELGAEAALAVVNAYLGDSLDWYVKKSHALEYLKRDAGQIWIKLQQRTGQANPVATSAKVAFLGPDAEVVRHLQDYPPGDAQKIARQALLEHSVMLARLDKARYIGVRQGSVSQRFSIEELRA